MSWRRESWTLGWNAQFYDSYRARTVSDDPARIAGKALQLGSDRIPSQIYHDVFAAFSLDAASGFLPRLLDRTEIRLGIRNVFNKGPVILPQIFGGSYSTYADPRMRVYSISLTKGF
jgi:outer membrane receptor protein involved in Fe transport